MNTMNLPQLCQFIETMQVNGKAVSFDFSRVYVPQSNKYFVHAVRDEIISTLK